MQVRISTCLGAEVVEESSEEVIGVLADMLIHPDTGAVEGFYVQVPGEGFGSSVLFCSSLDVLRFGARIYVRSADALGEPEEIIRLQPLLEDGRRVLGQPIRTESGSELGRCRDVQFDTESMHISWLFPKRRFRWGTGVPVSDIVEVRKDAIVVRDSPRPVMQLADEEKEPGLFEPMEVPDPAASRVAE